MTVRCFKNNLASRNCFFYLCNGCNFGIAQLGDTGFFIRLIIEMRMRLAVAMAVHVVFPVVVDGLVVVVHVCFHVFVFLVKVGCSGSSISCGVRVVRFRLVLRRIAES